MIGISKTMQNIFLLLLALVFVSGCVPGGSHNRKGESLYAEGNYQQAALALRQGVIAGNPASMCNLGTLYSLGKGVGVDPRKAIDLFNRCAKSKHSNARLKGLAANLIGATLHRYGNETDKKKVIGFMQIGARFNNPPSKSYLASLGLPVPEPDLYIKHELTDIAIIFGAAYLANSVPNTLSLPLPASPASASSLSNV